jgi:hypothetical protein
LRCPRCDAFLTAFAKATLPPRGTAVLNKPPQAWQSPRSIVSPEGLTLGLAGRGRGSGSGAGLQCLMRSRTGSRPYKARYRPTWFSYLEPQRQCDSWHAKQAWWRLAEEPAGCGKQQLQRQRSRQQARHPHQPELGPESIRLFDASVILKDLACHDFVGNLYERHGCRCLR